MNEKETFSEAVKSEICTLDFDKTKAKTILLSFMANNNEFYISSTEKKYIVWTHFLPNIRFLKKMFGTVGIKINSEPKRSNIKTASNKTKWILEIYNYEDIDKEFNSFTYDVNKFNDEQKQAFIIGGFLSGGSISFSSNKSNYHFEIRSRNKEYLNQMKKIFISYGLEPSVINYRNNYKLYMKKSEAISDTLKMLGAIDSLYYFEDYRIQKDFSNSLQRINNLDISNINKTVIAANNQLKWINELKKFSVIEKMDRKTQIFAEIRLHNKEISLEAISQIFKQKYNIEISRTSVNHIVRRLEKAYIELTTKK